MKNLIYKAWIAFLILLPWASEAQTVESVLRGIQERRYAVEIRKYIKSESTACQLIDWGDGISAYPLDGDVKDLPRALNLLNRASEEFDILRKAFIAFDKANSQIVNVRHTMSAETDSSIFRRVDGYFCGTGGARTSFEVPAIEIASVGFFNEENWIAKLRLLASNIEQLNAMEWPLLGNQMSATFDSFPGTEGVDPAPQSYDPWKHTIDFSVNYPRIQVFGQSEETVSIQKDVLISDNLVFSWDVNGWALDVDDTPGFKYTDANQNGQPDYPNEVVSEQEGYSDGTCAYKHNGFGGGFSLFSYTGVHAKIVPVPGEVGPPLPTGQFFLYKAPQISAFGDLTESLVYSGQLDAAIGAMKLIGVSEPQCATWQWGELSSDTGEKISTAVDHAEDWLGFGGIQISSSGSMSPACVPTADRVAEATLTWDTPTVQKHAIPRIFELSKEPTYRKSFGMEYTGPDGTEGAPGNPEEWNVPMRSVHEFSVQARCVAILNFSEVLPSSAKHAGVHGPTAGSVEPTLELEQMVRMHVGRSSEDANQYAWLGVRKDGFGSVEFHGSPKGFDLVYETDVQAFDDTPIGDRLFDAPHSFTQEQKDKSLWKDRFQYLAAWSTARLTQVKGRDVFVDISYTGVYTKKLEFYWASASGQKGGGKYTPTGNPFKTLIVSNPSCETAGLNGLPNLRDDGYSIRVLEDGQRTTLVKLENHQQDRPHFSVTVSAPGESEIKTEIKFASPWEITRSNGAVTVTDKVNYTPSPLETDRPRLRSLVEQTPDGERKTEYGWHTNGRPKDVVCTGPGSWGASGSSVTFDDDGTTKESNWKALGMEFTESREWDATKTKCTATVVAKEGGGTSTIGVKTFKWSPDLSEVKIADRLGDLVTQKRRPGMDPTFVPWTVSERKYPGEAIESSEWTATASGGTLTSTIKVDAGAELSRTTLETNALGGFKRSEQKILGVTVSSASVAQSDMTPWGAPKKITDLRGGVNQFTYDQSGLTAGALATAKNPSGTTMSIDAHDWLGRPTKIDTGFENLSFDYSDPLQLKVTSKSGQVVEQTEKTSFSSRGEFRSASTTIGSGTSAVSHAFEFNPDPTEKSTLTIDGRSVFVKMDAQGTVTSVDNGALSLGEQTEFGIENDRLYSKTKERDRDGGLSQNFVKVIYDERGRCKSMERIAENGQIATEVWTYDDANLSVTWAPGVGPLAQTITETLSNGGKTKSTYVGGVERFRESLSAGNGKLVTLTEAFDDSRKPAAGWSEVTRVEVEPAAGKITMTPKGLTANAVTITDSAPGAQATRTISSSSTGDTLTVKNTDGLPSAINGTSCGSNVDLDLTFHRGLLQSVDGTIGGLPAGMKIGTDWRVSQITGPGSKRNFTYGNGGGGAQFSVSDELQGLSGSLNVNSIGDVTNISEPGALPLALETKDVVGGSETTINGALTVRMNFSRSLTGKVYTGGFSEGYTRSGDGTVTTHSNGSVTAEISETPTARNISYEGTAIAETFYDVGLRKSVETGGDHRDFGYERFALKSEKHIAGVWGGWEVERLMDDKGRVSSLRVKQGGNVVREFGIGYDEYSRLNSATTAGVNAMYGPRAANGALATLSRVASGGSAVNTTWSYGGTGLLTGVANTSAGGNSFTYNFSEYDARRRIRKREALPGVTWSNLTYDPHDQLKSGNLSTGRNVAYGYNARGNRTEQGTEVTQVANLMDQVTNRTLKSRGIAVLGSVHKDADLSVRNSTSLIWGTPDSFNRTTGDFFKWWSVPTSETETSPKWITATVRGTLPPNVTGGPAAAEASVEFLVPPAVENLNYDGAGRLISDAFWNYTWNGPGQLTGMVRREETRSPALKEEVLTFSYDADGRRTKKTHTTVTTGEVSEVDESKFLWAGWLPVLELRSKNGVAIGRRWFQWGADRSGTADGAGGIGGLLSIIEEDTAGATKRILLPVQDGLGNITAVLNAANGQTVARYEFGPFGEPLGGSGELDACPFRWQSKWFDSESAHYYFGYRHYDPRMGRWLSRDPLGEAGGFNLYAYCGNDPVNRHDPLGLDYGDWPGVQRTPETVTALDIVAPVAASRYHRSPWGSQTAVIRRSMSVRVPFNRGVEMAGHALRVVGGAAEMYAGAAYTYATGGIGGWLGGGFLMANGADNIGAGGASLYARSYQPAYLERGITTVAGNGLVGNGLYVASQFGIGFGAPMMGSRLNGFLEGTGKMVTLEVSGLRRQMSRWSESGSVTVPGGNPFRRSQSTGLTQTEFGFVDELEAAAAETQAIWKVGRHGDMPKPRPPGMESHHGVNSVWMEANVEGYLANDAPAVLMLNEPFHNATRGVYNRMLIEIAARQGVSPRNVDWTRVSPGTAWRLAEEQFEAARAPLDIRAEFFQRFNEYLKRRQLTLEY